MNRCIYGLCKSKSSISRVLYLGYFEKFPVSYKPLQKCANLHRVTVHSFRRTYAYLLKTQKIHIATAQKLLDHSDPMMTLKVHTSVLNNEICEAGNILGNYLKIRGNLFPAYRATLLPIRWAQVKTALTFLFISV